MPPRRSGRTSTGNQSTEASTPPSAKTRGNTTGKESPNATSSSPSKATGAKRKAQDSPAKKEAPKKQKKIEETLPKEEDETEMKKEEVKEEDLAQEGPKDVDMAEAADIAEAKDEAKNEAADDEKARDKGPKTETGKKTEIPAKDSADNSNQDKKTNAEPEESIQLSQGREEAMPSNILEKGIIYFISRPRVGIDDPESVADLQRTYFVTRPLAKGAKLGDGPIKDSQNNRLFALPKKAFPKSHSDRFMAFVEVANTSILDLQKTRFKGEEHETKTQGTRETPPIFPVGEGVYAITKVGNTTHLVYMLTLPPELGEVQKEMGLKAKGSFVISIKNPQRKGPANAQLPQSPDFTDEILEEFRGLAWAPVRPDWLDYENAQILLIGEGEGDNLGSAVEPTKKDQKADKETPMEELEKLEHEDDLRVEHLHGNDTVFDDLRLSKDEFYKLVTTW